MLYICSIFWMICLFIDIGVDEKKKKEDRHLQMEEQSSGFVFNLKKKFKDFINSRRADEEQTGYFYDYKFGASGLYLKSGLGGI
jgi:hypothetical protein